jgi:hypothetical protein
MLYGSRKRCGCIDWVVAVFGAFLIAVLGLILGVIFAGFLFVVLPTLILAAVIFAILIIVRLIQNKCDDSYDCNCR